MALRELKADLHIHTCLSPCAGLDMSPLAVVQTAARKGLDLIGICDHNSAENVLAAKRAGQAAGLTVLGGMEVASEEEAHILVFFERDDDLLRFQGVVYSHLSGTNDEKRFGQQVIADEEDGVTGFCDRLLIAATSLPVEKIVATARAAAGDSLVIAAHVDRDVFSLIGQLGFIPPHLGLDAVEVSRHLAVSEAGKRFPDCTMYPVITASDAHRPEDIGSRIVRFTVGEGSIAEIRKALTSRDGRKVAC
ncbi:MAG: PHP domain-containing protein [Nitrospiraceae bacterium]|nr:PHP domain-containing protein [Nitrospiraceae bacterium]